MVATQPPPPAALFSAVFESAPFGIALVDEARRTVVANATMQRFERARLLTLERDGLRFCEPDAQREFVAAWDRVRGTTSLATVVLRGDRASGVLVVTVENVVGSGTIVRAILLDEVRGAEAATFETTLAATPAEARIAALLVRGRDGNEIGAELGVTRETVRTHIKRLLQKTGTRRQSELVLTLARAAMIHEGARLRAVG